MFASPRHLASLVGGLVIFMSTTTNAEQFYEVRSYAIGANGDMAKVQSFVSESLAPALRRQGFGPIGVLTTAPSDRTESPRCVVVIPVDDLGGIAKASSALLSDPQYRDDAKAYLDSEASNPPYQRIESELLVAMDCMPKLVIPDGMTSSEDRVFELRVYESANERIGNLKVEMFNDGEVPIFYDSGIIPIFIGQTMIGSQMPSLTYLTVYENEAARLKAWEKFRANPDWSVLSKDPKYANTVSRIDKYVLRALPGSDM